MSPSPHRARRSSLKIARFNPILPSVGGPPHPLIRKSSCLTLPKSPSPQVSPPPRPPYFLTFASQLTKDFYIFSGLGADERLFQNLDFAGYNPVFIVWIAPGVKETMAHYASRLIEQIKSPKPTLIGLSFGGMMAMEVSKLIDTEQVILISSAKTKNEIPFYYRIGGRIGIHKILPYSILRHSNLITNWFFGADSAFDKQLLKQILLDTDLVFLKWAIDKVVRWTNGSYPKKLIHIHGSRDWILPARYVKWDEIILDGGHFMVLNRSGEVNALLRRYL